jgi:hypothetical protein
MAASISAQTTFSDFNNFTGMYVMYKTADNELLSIVNAGDGNYFVRLYSYAETKETLVVARITKDFIPNIEIVQTARDGGEKQHDKLKAYLDRLFTYTAAGQNKNLPAAYTATKSSLDGKVLNKGFVDFYIPITNLLKETDGKGATTLMCVEFGFIYEDNLNSVLNFKKYPEFKDRPMKAIKPGKIQKLEIGRFTIEAPNNWQDNGLMEQYYYIEGVTERDAVIMSKRVDMQETHVAEIYAVIIMELSNVGAYVIPDSIKYTITKDKATLEFDFVDYGYAEYNKMIMHFYPEDACYYVLQINGYKDFIDKNRRMIDKILASARLKQ